MASDVIDDRRCRLPWDYGAIQETFSLAAWLLIPLPEVCKLRKPVLIMEAGPFSIFLAGMRTLAQDYEDHAAACSHAAEKTDDPVFRRMLLMLGLQ